MLYLELFTISKTLWSTVQSLPSLYYRSGPYVTVGDFSTTPWEDRAIPDASPRFSHLFPPTIPPKDVQRPRGRVRAVGSWEKSVRGRLALAAHYRFSYKRQGTAIGEVPLNGCNSASIDGTKQLVSERR